MAQRTVVAANNKAFKHSCCCLVVIFLFHQLTVSFAADVPAPSATANTTDAETNATFLEAIAEPLVRYRRQPPRTIVKHIIRPKRIKVKRFKRPKIKYSFAEPPPTIYYRKANSKHAPMYSHAPTYDSSIFEDFSHLNVESADFDLPPSSYEAQSMDLDLYKSYEGPTETQYKESEKPSSYTYAAPEVAYKEAASYSYAASPPSKAKGARKPHSQYGVPTEFVYSTGYDKPSGHSYSYEEPSTGYDKPSSGESYAYHPPSYEEPSKTAEKPSSSYSSPGYDKPSSGNGYSYHPSSYEEPSKAVETPSSSYSSSGYDKPSGGNGYSYHPPSYEEPAKTVEKPSSSYSSSGYDKPSGGNSYSYHPSSYEEPTKTVENPSSSYSGYDKPSGGNSYSYHPASYEEPSKTVAVQPSSSYSRPYSKPAQPPPRIPATKYGVPDVHIPLPNYGDYHKYSLVEHKAPSSYENFESINNHKHHFAEPPDGHDPNVKITYSPSYEINIPTSDEHHHHDFESVPPQQYNHPAPKHHHHQANAYQESSDTHQPPKYEPAPSQDLPINHNHRHPNYDYPKSSYEVPIYDPIPFDSSTNQEREVYPPQPFDNSSWKEASNTEYAAEPNNVSEQKPSQEVDSHSESESESEETPHEDTHSAGTRPQSQSTDITPTRPRRKHKRKRTKGTTAMSSATTKHILDVPELEEAFENEKRNKYHAADADINESHKVVKVNGGGPWNPLRIRTPALSVTTPTTTLAMNQYHGAHGSRNPYQHRSRTTTTTTEPPPPPPQPAHTQHQSNHIPNVEIVSIEKSRSKTYYDGILSTPKIYNTNFYRNRYKVAEPLSSTVSPHVSGSASKERFSKRTTKNVFDTTIFKSPLTDRDIYRNLPKNHKLF